MIYNGCLSVFLRPRASEMRMQMQVISSMRPPERLSAASRTISSAITFGAADAWLRRKRSAAGPSQASITPSEAMMTVSPSYRRSFFTDGCTPSSMPSGRLPPSMRRISLPRNISV